MKTCDLFKHKKLVLSAEVFPPKKTGNLEGVIRALKSIKSVGPDFVSVTYGAGGEGADTTADVASIAIDAFGINTVAHMTAVNMTVGKLESQVEMLSRKGIENILVLRGDVCPTSRFFDFHHASDLAEYLSTRHPEFNLIGACYPEKHPEAKTLEEDIDNLKRKIDCGVTHLITQLFLDNDKFFRFLDLTSKKGINVPIEAGIMPMFSAKTLEHSVSLSDASVPAEFLKLKADNPDEKEFFERGISLAVKQIDSLIKGGAKGIHLYTMNKGEIAERILPKFKNDN
ncbi:methylenetetrahydrofolate reductase [Acidaminococcus sp. CAG:917]|nr:methylenetetrahydrofolate reductase [Acidaminococcus sp. CAG:917]